MGTYILKKIKKLEADFDLLMKQRHETYNFCGKQCPIYDEKTFWAKFHRISGQIDILYMTLTGHDNKYEESMQNGRHSDNE